ncbi:hypothetical protein CARUB_v10020573mg [Capsella rubella]|uniref:DUF4408 domain-containing protein n=1 Tax=Capsella rubella TaxID=81985 RepID=R0GCG1_9BRAS|nr:uncharacterized protein LOC17895707 [Capsella rubella]EOA33427.1 hypothetical protein CARUB_v10020573mg [Capsella rubella]
MVSWMMTIKAVLLSSGVASVVMLLKVSVPVAVDFSVSQALILWSSLLSWLKPPYLYVVTNGIIITIVASSKYYRSHHDRDEEDEIVVYGGGGGGGYKIHQTEEPVVNQHQAPPRMLEVKDLDSGAHFGFVVANPEAEELESEVVTVVEEEEEIKYAVATAAEDEIEEELKRVIMVENSDLVESDFVSLQNSNQNHLIESENLPPIEKPLVSSRFSHRKLMKASQEGVRALRVTKPKGNEETLENIWKMITEEKRKLYRRSDTFTRGDSSGCGVDGEAKPVYKKSETFRDRTNYYQTLETTAKMRKEPSLSQDELNRRVEAFIKKTNEEMKLQRLESLRQYKEITSRGV